MKIKYSSIIATGLNHELGLNNKIPWKDSEDMLRFQTLTVGKVCIMGKKTYDALPVKPLKNRINIVFTTNQTLCEQSCEQSRIWNWKREDNIPFYVDSIRDARSISEVLIEDYQMINEVMICGGKQIYDLFFNLTSRIYHAKIKSTMEADTFYNIDELTLNGWQTIVSQRRETHDFRILEKETVA